MVNATDQYLTDKVYKYSFQILKSFETQKVQKLEASSRKKSCNKKAKASSQTKPGLTTTEENELSKKRSWRGGSVQVLIQTVWWFLTQYFGLWGRQEHHSMAVKDFSFGLDKNYHRVPLYWVHQKTDQNTPVSKASFQKCLLLEVINGPLKSSKSFCCIVFLKYVQPVYVISLVCQNHSCKFGTRDSQWKIHGKPFPTIVPENSGKEAENSSPRVKFFHKSNRLLEWVVAVPAHFHLFCGSHLMTTTKEMEMSRDSFPTPSARTQMLTVI